ncbi:MAG: hypothetical protein N3F05_03070 [Candidatus Diapherotrites archaeon]|nr:hypothetical protein [Candidatus Diapherotrites archaeon]
MKSPAGHAKPRPFRKIGVAARKVVGAAAQARLNLASRRTRKKPISFLGWETFLPSNLPKKFLRTQPKFGAEPVHLLRKTVEVKTGNISDQRVHLTVGLSFHKKGDKTVAIIFPVQIEEIIRDGFVRTSEKTNSWQRSAFEQEEKNLGEVALKIGTAMGIKNPENIRVIFTRR